MRKYLSVFISCIIAGMINFDLLYSQDDFNKWLEEDQKEQEIYLQKVTDQFDSYVQEQEKLYEEFKEEVEKKWDEFRYSSKKTYVDYDEDLDSRANLDFEKGEVEVEVIVEKDPKSTNKELAKKGEAKLKKKLELISKV